MSTVLAQDHYFSVSLSLHLTSQTSNRITMTMQECVAITSSCFDEAQLPLHLSEQISEHPQVSRVASFFAGYMQECE